MCHFNIFTGYAVVISTSFLVQIFCDFENNNEYVKDKVQWFLSETMMSIFFTKGQYLTGPLIKMR